MDTQFLMKTAMLAGELMLRSGAETYRVEDTMHHILKTAENVENTEIVVLMTGISATLKCADEPAVTRIKRVDSRATNINGIVEVNAISRKYCGQYITLEKAYENLEKLRRKIYSPKEYHVAVIGVCAGFAIVFGGGIAETAASAVVGMVLAFCVLLGDKLKLQDFIRDVIASAGIAFVSILLKKTFGNQINTDVVVIASIMPLVPGIAITNAVRDTLEGDYISGVARMLEAFLKAAGIAVGIGIGIAVFGGILLGGAV